MPQILKLTDQKDQALEGIYNCIVKSKRILAIVGAGISCSGGIPVTFHTNPVMVLSQTNLVLQDFRSAQGLFGKRNGKMNGKDIFDTSRLTVDNYAEWCKSLAKLREKIADATLSDVHGFLWVLHCKRKLQRIYTQNIDALEDRVGIPLVEVQNHKSIKGGYVPLHGCITRLWCPSCSETIFFGITYWKTFGSGKQPPCPFCIAKKDDSIYFHTLSKHIFIYLIYAIFKLHRNMKTKSTGFGIRRLASCVLTSFFTMSPIPMRKTLLRS